MMIHEKLNSGKFLLDLNNEHINVLNGNHHPHDQKSINELHPHHSPLTTHFLNLSHHHQIQHPSLQQQLPPPEIDIGYAVYAYHQQQQRLQFMNNNNNNKHNDILINNNNINTNDGTDSKAEVLDLSRRCDSVETPHKTPSPAQTNSSVGTVSPVISPKNPQQQQETLANDYQHSTAWKEVCGNINLPNPTLQSLQQQEQQQQQQSIIPSNLLYSAQAQQQPLQMSTHLPLPVALASLYPRLCYPPYTIKPEPKSPMNSPSTTPPIPPLPLTTVQRTPATTPTLTHIQLPIKATTDLLQTFATTKSPISLPSPPETINECKTPSSENPTGPLLPTPTSHLNLLTALDDKNTRPFKALPRDPIAIAASFAANDVMLDDQRVERYTEYRKRVLEDIRNSNGGTRSVTNPKMRRTNSRSVDSNACHSSSEDGQERNSSKASINGADESSDCDSNVGSYSEKVITSSSGSTTGTQNTTTTTTASSTSTSGIVKDAAYLERRRKNNAAAKKSRDRRRFKEDELAIRAEYLARENYQLHCEIKSLKAQLAAYTSKVST